MTAPCRRRPLSRDTRGLAMIEFALGLSVVLPIGLYAIETSHYAMTQLQLSQVTLALADNASRAGVDAGTAAQELREVDIDDVLDGMRFQARGLDIAERGRVTISSLEPNSGNSGGQMIRWQRCLGLKRGAGWDSSYGREGDGTTASSPFPGMGTPERLVKAPSGSAIMFVEINYDYRPVVPAFFNGTSRLHQVATFVVRDNRALAKGITNPVPAAPKRTCDLYTA